MSRSKERQREVAISNGDSIRGGRKWKPKSNKAKAAVSSQQAVDKQLKDERAMDKACRDCACSTCLHFECLRDYCPAGHAAQNKPLGCSRCTASYRRMMAGDRVIKVVESKPALTTMGLALQKALAKK